jgi:hypothetical protein
MKYRTGSCESLAGRTLTLLVAAATIVPTACIQRKQTFELKNDAEYEQS